MNRKRLALCGFVLGGLALLAWRSTADEPAAVPAGVTTLKGHTEAVYGVAFSPDGGSVATASFDKTLKLWDAATGKEVKTLGGQGGHQNLVLTVAFSPNGQMLASGSTDNTAKLWDVPSRKFVQEFVHPDAVNGLALSADGLRLAAAGQDGTVTVWTPTDGKQVQKLTGENKAVTSVAFNASPAPAGQVVAGGGADGSLRLWNPNNGQPLGAVTGAGSVTGVALHPNNTVAYTVAEDGTLRFWQLPLAASRNAAPQGDVVTALALSPDGNQVVSGGADKTVRIINVADTKQLQQLAGPTAAVLSVASSPNVIAAGTQDQRLFLWNPRDGKLLYQALAHAGPVTAVAFPQANQLLTAGGDGIVKAWAMPPVPGRALTHPDAVLAAAGTADGKHLITGSADKIVRIWNLTNQQVERQLTGHAAAVTAVAVSGNGQVLVSGSADQTIRLWDPANGKPKATIGAHDGSITSLALNAAGNQVLSAALDGTIKLWNLAAPAPKLLSHGDQVTSVALSPDGSHLLTGCTDKQARLWNLGTGKMDRAFPGNTLAVSAVAFGANGTLVAAGGADKSLTVWNAADAKEVKKFAKLPAGVHSVAIHPAAKLLATQVAAGLADNTIRLFDLAQGKETKTLKGHTGVVNAVAYLPTGDRLISASADGTAQVWSLLPDVAPKTKLDYGSPAACLALTKDGTRVAVGGAGKAVKIWTLADAKLVGTITTPAEIKSLAFSADGSRLVVGGSDHLARVYGVDGRLVEFFPQEGAVLGVAFHPDGKQIIAGGADKTARIWTTALVWQAVQGGPVRQAIFSTKGDQVITAGEDKTIRIWNAADGKPVKQIAAHNGPVAAVAMSPDGSKIVSAGADNQVKVWSTAAPKPGVKAEDKPAQVTALAGAPQSLAISPNGTRLAVALQEKTTTTVNVFDLATGKVLLSVPDQSGRVRALVFQGDNRTLISAGADKTARLTDVGVLSMFAAHAGGVTALAVHNNGTQALTGGADKTVKLWNLPGAKEAAVVRTFGPLADPVTAVAFSRDYTQVGAAAGKVVKVWTAADGKEVLTLTHPAAVLALSFSLDKTRIVTGADDGRARVWDVATGKELQAFPLAGPVRSVVFHNNNNTVISASPKTVGFHPLAAVRVIAAAAGPIRAVTVTPNGSHVLTSDGKEVKLWNTGNGAKEPRAFTGAGEVQAIAVSKNGALVATGGTDQNVRVFNFADGKQLGQFPAAGAIRSLAFSPNNQSLTAACADHSLQTWHVAYNPGQPVPPDFGRPGPIYTHDAAATAVVYAPDSMHFYSAGLDHKIRAWKFAADTPIKNLPHPNFVDAVAFNPAGTQLATGCHDGSVRLWDVAKGQVVREIKAHAPPPSNAVYCVAWSPDGKQVVSGSLDHSLKLWDATSGQMVREFKGYKEKEFPKGHRDGVFAVAFSPDSKQIVSASSDHTVKFWNVADGNVIRECVNPKLKPTGATGEPPQAHPGWVYSLRFTPDGKTLVSVGNAARNHGYLALWGAADGKFLYGEELPLGAIYSVAVAPDGKQLALSCGPRGRQAQDANGYILKTPEPEKKGP